MKMVSLPENMLPLSYLVTLIQTHIDAICKFHRHPLPCTQIFRLLRLLRLYSLYKRFDVRRRIRAALSKAGMAAPPGHETKCVKEKKRKDTAGSGDTASMTKAYQVRIFVLGFVQMPEMCAIFWLVHLTVPYLVKVLVSSIPTRTELA